MSQLPKEQLIRRAQSSGHLTGEDTAYIIYDLAFLRDHMNRLVEAFPDDTLHAVATKACPLPAMLAFQNELGLGAEGASRGEIYLALDSGIPGGRIIFDSPAKTRADIEFALEKGIYLNADCFEELERLDEILKEGKYDSPRIGLRINPVIGEGKISTTSVAGKTSKFGEPLTRDDEIRRAYQHYPWLSGVHVHIGSQGMSPEALIKGTKAICDFAAPIDQIVHFDLGGGLPVRYREGDEPLSFGDYGAMVKEKIPTLVGGRFHLLTEFGRAVFANAAIAVSPIEYAKADSQLVIHLGADMFMRPVYQPHYWGHEMFLHSSDGERRTGPEKTYRVVGPLCFAGDILAQEVQLPQAHPGDLLVIDDVGAYTLSMWSRHCSRQLPVVLGVDGDDVTVLKKRESREDLYRFWS